MLIIYVILNGGTQLGIIHYSVVPRIEEWVALPGGKLYKVIRVVYDFSKGSNNYTVTIIVEDAL